jgi:hypothetical protein
MLWMDRQFSTHFFDVADNDGCGVAAILMRSKNFIGSNFCSSTIAPDPAAIPDIAVKLVPLHLYDELGTVRLGDAA